jgi:hypothetical protein
MVGNCPEEIFAASRVSDFLKPFSTLPFFGSFVEMRTSLRFFPLRAFTEWRFGV